MSEHPKQTTPSDLSIADYSYELPEDRIAKYPLEQRNASKLLIYRNGEIEERKFTALPALLESGDCLVFNDTKVVHARIQFQRDTGATIEVFCLEPSDPYEISEALASKGSTVWKAMVGNAKRWKPNEVLTKSMQGPEGVYALQVSILEKAREGSLVQFTWDADLSFAEVMEDAGTLPIPPYLNRDTEEDDEVRYQTVYASADGSVAAPTAGLHFTPSIFDALGEQQVQSLFVTLHVGAGTFKPVKSATMHEHEMHQERISVTKNAIERMLAAAHSNRIVAVGTTSLRTIESIYWFGVKLLQSDSVNAFFVGQWEPYALTAHAVEASVALEAVLSWMQRNDHSHLYGATQILIAPGYQIRMADVLITNFHQPRSTLLLLIAAYIGDDWRRVYEYALANDFRFLSFGDSSMLIRNKCSHPCDEDSIR